MRKDKEFFIFEKCYKDKAKKVIRYAFEKEKDVFDTEKLNQVVAELTSDYKIKIIEEAEYNACRKNRWANDLVSQYKDYNAYKKLGLGVVILKDGDVVAGASSYSTYEVSGY